jgi:3-dehydroquinate dehydratase
MQIDIVDWRVDIFNYMKDLAQETSKQIRYKALRYILI